jgi:uncharacterized protein (TIGR02246 family)
MASTEDSVTAFFEKLGEVWKSNDGAAFAACFTEDGSLINPFGERADGRAALTGMYNEYFAGMLQGTTTTIDLAQLRPLGDDYAFTDADQTIYGTDGNVLLALHAVNLLRRHGDDWQLADSRPYTFPPPA